MNTKNLNEYKESEWIQRLWMNTKNLNEYKES